eukprot:968567_1
MIYSNYDHRLPIQIPCGSLSAISENVTALNEPHGTSNVYPAYTDEDMPMLRKMVEETKQPVRKQQSEEHCQNKECTLSEFTERLDDIAHEPNNTNQFNRNDATSRPHKRRKISKNKFVSGCDDAKDDVLDDPYRDDDYRNQIEMENDTMSEYSEDDDDQSDIQQRKRQHIASFEKKQTRTNGICWWYIIPNRRHRLEGDRG